MITTTLIRRRRGYNESPTTGGTVTVTIRDSGSNISVLIETDDEYYLTRTASVGEYDEIVKKIKPVFFREKKQAFCARPNRAMINMKKFRLRKF